MTEAGIKKEKNKQVGRVKKITRNGVVFIYLMRSARIIPIEKSKYKKTNLLSFMNKNSDKKTFANRIQ